jgi:thiol-disulfide isomerase/thioredoxin
VSSGGKLSLAIYLLGSISSLGREDSPPTAFEDVSYESALKQAEREHKIVFIDFFTTWCGPCKMLDASTWRDPAVIALLKEKTVALRIDAEKSADLAKRYSIEAYPTMVLIRPDGTVIDTLVGYEDPRKFSENFASSLAGTTSLMRAREAAEKAQGSNPQAWTLARYTLGQELANKGEDAQALTEYLWCFDDGMKNNKGLLGVRESFLLTSIGNLGRHYPLALDALRVRRDKARAELPASSSDSVAFQDFSCINHALGEDQVTLSYFDKLPPKSPKRAALGEYVFELLLSAQRYGDAVSARPYALYKTHLEVFKEAVVRSPAEEAYALRAYIISDAAKELEVLAGAGKLDDARDLLKTTLEFDHSAATVATLHEHLKRAGHVDL